MNFKLLKLTTVITALFLVFSCSSSDDDNTEEAYKFSIEKAKHSINFTSYKTTEKLPVTGSLTTLKITSGGKGNSIKEALNQAGFSLPVADVLMDESTKTYNIINHFFLKMTSPEFLTGTIVMESETAGYINLKMNNETHKVPFTCILADKKAELKANLLMSNWHVTNALKSLNDRCGLLHMGSDGISKVWDTVDINVQVEF